MTITDSPFTPPGRQLSPKNLTAHDSSETPESVPGKSNPTLQDARLKNTGKPTRACKRPPPDGYDGSSALPNLRYEAMAINRWRLKLSQHECLLRTGTNPFKDKLAAKAQASAIFNRPDVKLRVTWLRLHPIEAEKQLGIDPLAHVSSAPTVPLAEKQQPEPPKPPAENAEIVTRERVQRLVSGALANAGTSREIIDAVGVAIKLMPQLAEDPADHKEPDPTEIMRQLCSYGGHPGPELVKKFGLRVFVQRLKEFTGASNAALIGALLPEDNEPKTPRTPQPIVDQPAISDGALRDSTHSA